jgi:hypothetical protein
MDNQHIQIHPLHLELLESRTLLAGGWEADFAAVTPAVSGTGDYALAFNPRIGSSELIITGTAHSNLTINFDILPAFVTSVNISHFDAVLFTGSDTLTKLVAADIDTLHAPGISINLGVYSDHVNQLTLATGGGLALLTGTSTKLEIAKLDGTLIISDLQSLALASESPNLSIVSLNSTQVVKVLYAPDQISVAGLTDSQSQVLMLPNGEETAPVVPDPGVVVIVTPSDSTNTLLARLRELIRSGVGDNDQLAFSLVSQHAWQVGDSEIRLVAMSGTAAPGLLEAGKAIKLAHAEITPGDLDLESGKYQTLGDMELSGLSGPPAQVEFTDIAMPPGDWGTGAPAVADAGNAFDVAFMPATDGEGLDSPKGYFELQEWLHDALVTDPVNLKDQIMERIAAELTPGEQTAFLLVDPKPGRAGLTRNRESALDSFG